MATFSFACLALLLVISWSPCRAQERSAVLAGVFQAHRRFAAWTFWTGAPAPPPILFVEPAPELHI